MNRFSSLVIWIAVVILGVFALGSLAWSRGEPVNAMWIIVAGGCFFAVSYRFYSAWLMAKVLTINDERATPAVTRNDGKDYVPTHKWMVFGHHFAAIAGPGPLVGPVLASQFGFLPGTLWILIGATLGGGVHDSIMLFASVRRNGKSLGRMVKEEIGPVTGMIAMICLLAIMMIILAVLALVVVKALADSPWGLFTIAMTIPVALVMGFGGRFFRLGIVPVTIIGIAGLMLSVYGGGLLAPGGALHSWAEAFTWKKEPLAFAIIIYGFAASVLPIWMLLAPRDYLSTFLKIGAVAALAIAIILAQPLLHMPALTAFAYNGMGLVAAGPVFPFVCITIACAAISGFHSLISTGTTPKMIAREADIRSVAYGGMIVEMLVGLMAIIAACSMEPGEYFAINTAGTPVEVIEKVNTAGLVNARGDAVSVTMAGMEQLAKDVGEPTLFGKAGGAPTFAVGMAQMFAKALGGPAMMAFWYHFAVMFEALFILTTIDAGTRVGRFMLQDLLGSVWKPLGNTGNWAANTITSALLVVGWGYFLIQGVRDPNGGINSLWPIFGISNQLLAVIAFSLGTTILIKMGKKRYMWVTVIPLVFLTVVTFSAGTIKLTHPHPRVGFAAEARMRDGEAEKARLSLVTAATPAARLDAQKAIDKARAQAFNARLNAGVTSFFMLGVALILIGSIKVWWEVLSGRKEAKNNEAPFIQVDESAPALAQAMH